MKKLVKQLAILSILALAITGCGKEEAGAKEKKENPPAAEAKAKTETKEAAKTEEASKVSDTVILDAVKNNLLLAEQEDLDAYMDTLANVYQTQENIDGTKQLFDNFDLDYEILSSEIVSKTDTAATVKVRQKTTATAMAEGMQFRDNEVVVEHQLILEDGKWRINDTKVIETKYLD